MNILHASKIINDPVHGFIEINNGLILTLINHPIFQRLRRIRQLSLSSQVYPGAMHTRFHHALGALHLMTAALDVLRRKQIFISEEEYEAAQIAILLHDIGHGPFSHALEKEIIRGFHHEHLSIALMNSLNKELNGKLTLAIEMFKDTYPRHFFHQLISGQLDMDRMDYLMRDSFFTGVLEGTVGADRIIKTLNVCNNQLVVESKGIYSVEKFIMARRLMYWQVYLHKAAVAAETMLVKILKRVRMLTEQGEAIFLGDALAFFLRNSSEGEPLIETLLEYFVKLDDSDITYSIKQWQGANDRVLSDLCQRIINRNLLRVYFQHEPVLPDTLQKERDLFCEQTGYTLGEAAFFVFEGKVSNQAYDYGSGEPILIWYKSGEIIDFAQASDMQNPDGLSREVVKHYLCKPKFRD